MSFDANVPDAIILQKSGKRKLSKSSIKSSTKKTMKKIGLEKLTITELYEKAKKRNILNVRSYKKDELIAILRKEKKVPTKTSRK